MAQLDELRLLLEKLERISGRRRRKWSGSGELYKARYVQGLVPILDRFSPIYWRKFGTGTCYDLWVGTAIADAWLCCGRSESLTVTVDGLQEKQTESIRRLLRNRGVRFRVVRGRQDEVDALLRLADAVVGFVRDARRGVAYTQELWPQVRPSVSEKAELEGASESPEGS